MTFYTAPWANATPTSSTQIRFIFTNWFQEFGTILSYFWTPVERLMLKKNFSTQAEFVVKRHVLNADMLRAFSSCTHDVWISRGYQRVPSMYVRRGVTADFTLSTRYALSLPVRTFFLSPCRLALSSRPVDDDDDDTDEQAKPGWGSNKLAQIRQVCVHFLLVLCSHATQTHRMCPMQRPEVCTKYTTAIRWHRQQWWAAQ